MAPMGESSGGFPAAQPPQRPRTTVQGNGPDAPAFLEQIVNLPIEAFRNHLVNFRTKIKALEDQRDRFLQVNTPQMLEQAQKVQAQVNGLQNIMQQLVEAYQRRQAAAMGLGPAAAHPSGQQGGQPPASVAFPPQHLIATTMQGREEQEISLQQRQIQAQQEEDSLSTQKESPQLGPDNRPSPGLGGPQIGPGTNALQASAPAPPHQLPSSVPLLPGLNVSQEQLMKAQEKVRAAIGLFHNKRDYSSINLSHEAGILLEQSLQQTQSLLKQVAQNLVSFVVLAPNDERELNQVAQTIVTLSDQGQILQKPPPEKRFIFGLGDLNNYRNHLTTFLMRVKGLQGQAMALQNQQNSGPLSSVPPPVAQQELAPAPLQPAG
ncbi:hypothetical protein FS837_001883 [Tulasnella sp. UAMH 9824]|nr:hypothetical protein FS837_001883 [Tulasnella sp. UAMH 9824]